MSSLVLNKLERRMKGNVLNYCKLLHAQYRLYCAGYFHFAFFFFFVSCLTLLNHSTVHVERTSSLLHHSSRTPSLSGQTYKDRTMSTPYTTQFCESMELTFTHQQIVNENKCVKTVIKNVKCIIIKLFRTLF